MKQEEKQLLLKDLCARLPYKVMIQSVGENKCLGLMDLVDIDLLPKPYLCPLSSMTEEEKKDFRKFQLDYSNITYDWLNAHHYDYRNLIEKNLALEAPEGMYKKK